MNRRLLEIVKIERDAVCILNHNGVNKKLDHFLNVYCKYEQILIKPPRANKARTI